METYQGEVWSDSEMSHFMKVHFKDTYITGHGTTV
jgi:hypothetical protein